MSTTTPSPHSRSSNDPEQPLPLPLTRTASLDDFAECRSVASWQQQLAIEAWQRWGGIYHDDLVVCLNWGAAQFRSPGNDPIYRSFQDGAYTTVESMRSVVFALSVLDRIEQPLHFLRYQARLLFPSGLLVCTFAAWDATGEDCAIGHELRHRIYNRETLRKLLHEIRGIGLEPFGGIDLRYRGHALGDHTLASLVAVKRS
jgi:hypothetical protein